jgi:hypothetical protein
VVVPLRLFVCAVKDASTKTSVLLPADKMGDVLVRSATVLFVRSGPGSFWAILLPRPLTLRTRHPSSSRVVLELARRVVR